MKERINFVVALSCEARPIIRHFGLHHRGSTPFKVYTNEDETVWLIISGIGKVASSSATGYLASRTKPNDSTGWLNVGIAGHREMSVGTAILGNKITDVQSGQSWCPLVVFETPCETASIETVEKPTVDYSQNNVVEMEASGFYISASRFANPGKVQVLKVISDNEHKSLFEVNRSTVAKLIENNLGTIEEIIDLL